MLHAILGEIFRVTVRTMLLAILRTMFRVMVRAILQAILRTICCAMLLVVTRTLHAISHTVLSAMFRIIMRTMFRVVMRTIFQAILRTKWRAMLLVMLRTMLHAVLDGMETWKCRKCGEFRSLSNSLYVSLTFCHWNEGGKAFFFVRWRLVRLKRII